MTTTTYTNGTKPKEQQAPPTLPPHNEEAEQAVLGSLMIDPSAVTDVAHIITADMFYRVANRQIYQTILDLWRQHEPIDYLLIRDLLDRNGQLDGVGGDYYLAGLAGIVPTAINARHYAEVIKEAHTRRQLITTASAIAKSAYDESLAIDDVTRDAETAVLAVRGNMSNDRMVHAGTVASQFLDDLQSDKPIGIPSGYLDLDRCIGGLEPGNGYWFCGAEKMGKTSFINRISLTNALAGKVVIRFSLEMTAKQRMRRDVAILTGISVKALKTKLLADHQWTVALDAVGKLSNLHLITDDTPAQCPSHIRSVCNRVMAEYGRIDLIELDYFQLCQADKPTSNYVADLMTISSQLVAIVKDFNVPLVGTAQVTSKQIDMRNNKEPHLSDVYGSTALIKDGYFISFIYRDEYYNPDTTQRPGEADLIVRAHRDGDTPRIALQFDGPTAQFRNLSR